MKISINTEVLKKYSLSLEQFIVLLASYYNIDCQKVHDELISTGLAEKDLFNGFPPVISDNTKNLIAKVIVESDDKILNCGIDDFDALAKTLQEIYPDGTKPGTTYKWREGTDVVAQKLRTIVVKHDFQFTEEEAVAAVSEYVNQFKTYEHMHLLRNFILRTTKHDGHLEIDSLFMSYIENQREKHED